MLGISFYPDKESIADIQAYIRKAAKLGYRRCFTSLLELGKNADDTIDRYQQVIQTARENHMAVILDVNPSIFEALDISYKDLHFFKDIGATGIRLDSNFDGLEESLMSFNEFGLDIELNMSNDSSPIFDFQPNMTHVIGCHNFYPQPFTGLSLDYFMKCSAYYKQKGMRTAAFVTAKSGADGPHDYNDGLPTLEMHRKLDIVTQAKHLIATGLIDDIIISNAIPDDVELEALSQLDQSQLKLAVDPVAGISPVEQEILFENQHFNRGDVNEYSIRSTFVRVKYQEADIPAFNAVDQLQYGDITIGNNSFGQYKGELGLVTKPMPNIGGHKNVVGHVTASNQFLIPYITSWSKFKFEVNE
ncbi:DUF871 domain-containing protein [Lactobacillus sp. CC-MHH1034]|uniref:DUF871 domain-containing protein n=1 Tax=Agrilactobacillus fermenti TaxID=2586909 RepID=UPI001E50FF39|nr:MupG family TIM beta-alpha barrel fold protein [Agrilactobacillus fermenti]MCD2257344.1 DUF871 domain-containing protein [Agrilactobacillus fermenti]